MAKKRQRTEKLIDEAAKETEELAEETAEEEYFDDGSLNPEEEAAEESLDEAAEEEPAAQEVLPQELRDGSIKKKPRKKKRRRRKANPITMTFLLILVLFAGYRFLRSSFFTLTDIEVSGNKYYTPAQVEQISGIQPGWNIFSYKRDEAKAALLADPYIKLADISLELPSTMRIDITEREEYACIPYGEQYILIDREGTVLRIADSEPVLPLLEGMTIIDMAPGTPLSTEETYLLSDTLELLSIVEEHDIYFKKVNFSTVVVRAYIKDQLYCEGTPANIRDNMAGIAKLAQELYQKGIDRGIIKVGKNSYLSFSPQIE